MKNKFWKFRNGAEMKANTLDIYGDISDASWWGDEVTPKEFKKELDQCSGPLEIFINSGGGDVFAGQAIYSMLRRYEGKKTVYVDGIAASIASVVAMAGDEIIMPRNAMMMIHNAWAIARGNKETMMKLAGELEKIDGVIAAIYAERGKYSAEEYAELMSKEKWFTAEEALEAGLIDRIDADKQIAAHVEDGFYCANGVQFEIGRYIHGDILRMNAEDAPEDHSNRGGSQPVDDKKELLKKQREKFNEVRKKIMEGIEGE